MLYTAMRCQVRPPAAAQPFQPDFCPIQVGRAFIDFFFMKPNEEEGRSHDFESRSKPSRKFLPYERRSIAIGNANATSIWSHDFQAFFENFFTLLDLSVHCLKTQLKDHNFDWLKFKLPIKNLFSAYSNSTTLKDC